MFGTCKIKELDTPRRLYMKDGDLVQVIFKGQGREADDILCQKILVNSVEHLQSSNTDRQVVEMMILEMAKIVDAEIEERERQTEPKEKGYDAQRDSVTDIIREEDVKEKDEAEDFFVDLVCNLAKNGYNKKTSIWIWIVNKLLLLSKNEKPPHKRLEFRVNTHFSEFKQWYSDHVNYPDNNLTMRFNGKEIKDDETPEDLEMKDNDVIEVHFAVPLDEQNRKIFLNKQRR